MGARSGPSLGQQKEEMVNEGRARQPRWRGNSGGGYCGGADNVSRSGGNEYGGGGGNVAAAIVMAAAKVVVVTVAGAGSAVATAVAAVAAALAVAVIRRGHKCGTRVLWDPKSHLTVGLSVLGSNLSGRLSPSSD